MGLRYKHGEIFIILSPKDANNKYCAKFIQNRQQYNIKSTSSSLALKIAKDYIDGWRPAPNSVEITIENIENWFTLTTNLIAVN